MLIRTASMNDLDAVTAVESECFPSAEVATRAEFAKRLSHYANHFWLMYNVLKNSFQSRADRILYVLFSSMQVFCSFFHF